MKDNSKAGAWHSLHTLGEFPEHRECTRVLPLTALLTLSSLSNLVRQHSDVASRKQAQRGALPCSFMTSRPPSTSTHLTEEKQRKRGPSISNSRAPSRDRSRPRQHDSSEEKLALRAVHWVLPCPSCRPGGNLHHEQQCMVGHTGSHAFPSSHALEVSTPFRLFWRGAQFGGCRTSASSLALPQPFSSRPGCKKPEDAPADLNSNSACAARFCDFTNWKCARTWHRARANKRPQQPGKPSAGPLDDRRRAYSPVQDGGSRSLSHELLPSSK